MKTSAISIKIDPRVKRDAQRVAGELGFSLSAIITASLKNLVRSKTISYSLFEPTPLLKNAIESSRIDRACEKSSGPFSRVSDIMESLRS